MYSDYTSMGIPLQRFTNAFPMIPLATLVKDDDDEHDDD